MTTPTAPARGRQKLPKHTTPYADIQYHQTHKRHSEHRGYTHKYIRRDVPMYAPVQPGDSKSNRTTQGRNPLRLAGHHVLSCCNEQYFSWSFIRPAAYSSSSFLFFFFFFFSCVFAGDSAERERKGGKESQKEALKKKKKVRGDQIDEEASGTPIIPILAAAPWRPVYVQKNRKSNPLMKQKDSG